MDFETRAHGDNKQWQQDDLRWPVGEGLTEM